MSEKPEPITVPIPYASAAALLADAPADDTARDLKLSTGLTVRVRSLTRAEHLALGKGDPGPGEIEARMVAKGLVEPRLSVGAVMQWQESARSSVLKEISDEIRDLSGFGQGADKSDV